MMGSDKLFIEITRGFKEVGQAIDFEISLQQADVIARKIQVEMERFTKNERAIIVSTPTNRGNFERLVKNLGLLKEQAEKIAVMGLNEYELQAFVNAIQQLSNLAAILETELAKGEQPEKPEHPGKTFCIYSGGRQCGRTALYKAYQNLQARQAIYKHLKIPHGNSAKSFRQTAERDLCQ